MTDINNIVLESINDFHPFKINTETPEGVERLANMHIRPKGDWEVYSQKPSNLYDRNGNRI